MFIKRMKLVVVILLTIYVINKNLSASVSVLYSLLYVLYIYSFDIPVFSVLIAGAYISYMCEPRWMFSCCKCLSGIIPLAKPTIFRE